MAGGWSHRGGCVRKLKSTEVENWSPPTDPSTTPSTLHAAVVWTQTNTKQTHPRLSLCPGALSVRAGMAAWPDWTVGMRLLIIHLHTDGKSTHPLRCSKFGFWFCSPFLSGSVFPYLVMDLSPSPNLHLSFLFLQLPLIWAQILSYTVIIPSSYFFNTDFKWCYLSRQQFKSQTLILALEWVSVKFKTKAFDCHLFNVLFITLPWWQHLLPQNADLKLK